MKRRLLLVVPALLLAAVLSVAWLLTSEAGLFWVFTRLAARVPGTVSIATVEGRLIGPIHMTGLRYQDAGVDDRIADLTLDWNPWTLFAGRLTLTTVRARGVHVMLPTGAGPAQTPEIRLPVSARLAHLAIDDITIAQAGAAPIHIAHLALAARTRAETVFIERLVLRSDALDVSLRGHVTPLANYPLDIDTRWTARLADYPPLSGAGRIRGDLKRLRLRQRLTAPLRADLSAEVRAPLAGRNWQVTLKLAALPLASLRPGLPAVTLTGELRAHGDRNRLAAEGTLSAVDRPASDVTLSAQADWAQPGPLRFDVNAQWRNIAELPPAELALSSARGSVHARGTSDAYTFSVDADLAQARAGALHLAGDAQGGRTALTIRHLRLQALGGALEAHGDLDWQRNLAWRITFDGRNLDPGRLWPQWPGKLAIRGGSDGRLGQTLTANLVIADASGTLRKQPFMLQAEAGIAGNRYTLKRLELRAGSARLQAHGGVADQWDVAWDLRAEELAQLLPEASGSLTTRGRLTGARATPSIAATLAGQRLRYRDYRVDAINAEADVDLADARDSRMTLAAKGVGAFDILLPALDIQAQGRASAHAMRMTLGEARGELRLSADGQYRDKHWRGVLREATLASPDYGDWTLEQPGEILLSRTEAVLHSSCWRWQEARLCSAAAWQASKGWNAQLSTEQLPTAVFAPWFATDATLRGTLDGEAQLQSPATGSVRGSVTLRASAGSIGAPGPGGAPTVLEYRAGRVALRIADERFDGTLQFQLADGGAIDLALAAPLRADDRNGNQPVRGHLKAEIRNLAGASVFVPQLEQPRGELTADLALGGSVAHPQLSGGVRLDHGALDIGRAGIHLRDARLNASSAGGNTVEIKGQASSAGGTLRIAGNGTLRTTGWRGTLRLEGENFEAMKTPELSLRVSPDLTLAAQPGRIDLSGKLNIPEGRFAAKDISQAVTVSPDTVIVGEGNAAAAERWQIHARVQIGLGDKVRVDAYNFRGRVTGTVLAVDEPQKATTGTGELRFESGTYEVYGRPLTIDPGRLVFAGGPIADPGLDVRAVRKVGDVLAGVQARGTLSHPVLTLFSEPAMDQTNALSYLLLGRPANQAAAADGALLMKAASSLGFGGGELLAKRIGQAFGIEEVRIDTGAGTQGPSLMLGTYLSPRLYVNYGIGLFAPVNTLRLRYDLSKHWQIQTESGAGTSADLLYTIER
jgi:translocation and assembly module TamB